MESQPIPEFDRNTDSGVERFVPTLSSTMEAVRGELQALGSPVVVFCKSHSGSRLLTQLIEGAGVYMGAHQNESSDSLDLLRLIEHLVEHYYPDYSQLWHSGHSNRDFASTAALIREVFKDHLRTHSAPSGRWGWKLCETLYTLPVVDFLFPNARFIHLIRDGRDVAFCNHTPPDTPFWKKVYFNTDRMHVWQRYGLSYKDYHRHSHVFNALHWTNSVNVGRNYGAMLRNRYLEVRYEDLCRDFRGQAKFILKHIGATDDATIVDRLEKGVYTRSIGKHNHEPRSKLRAILQIEKSLLMELGYLESDPFKPKSRSLRRRLGHLITAWLSRKPISAV